jgi:hypothetical protein
MSLALLVEGGSFFSGKRKCAVSVEDGDSVEVCSAKIWQALGMVDQASNGNIEIFEASWDEYVVFEERDQLVNKAKLRLASSAPAEDSAVAEPAEPAAEPAAESAAEPVAEEQADPAAEEAAPDVESEAHEPPPAPEEVRADVCSFLQMCVRFCFNVS